MIEQRKLQNIYLDWLNNFLTVERFAEYYGVTVPEANTLIEMCRGVHERLVEKCTNCNGYGHTDKDGFYECSCCKGSGKESQVYYRNSWDRLMPVIEKIESLGYSFEKNYQPIDKDWQCLIVKGYDILFQEFNADSKLSAHYVVSEFIQWYNENKEKELKDDN